MEKHFFLSLLAVIFLGIFGVVDAEETAKKWRNNKRKRSVDAVSSVVWAKYSEELAEMRKLRKEDPEAFKVKSKAFREKIRAEVKAERGKFKKLVMEYRKTKDPKTRKIINKYVSSAYDRRIKAEAKKIAMLKKKLEKAEQKLAKAKAKKEERINKILKTILKDPKLSW